MTHRASLRNPMVCVADGESWPCSAIKEEYLKAGERLQVTRSNFGGAIRQAQLAGMTPRDIGTVVGLQATAVRELINAWGLDT